jgi:hypothetical protein
VIRIIRPRGLGQAPDRINSGVLFFGAHFGEFVAKQVVQLVKMAGLEELRSHDRKIEVMKGCPPLSEQVSRDAAHNFRLVAQEWVNKGPHLVRIAPGGVQQEGNRVPAMGFKHRGCGMIARNYEDIGVEGPEGGDGRVQLL